MYVKLSNYNIIGLYNMDFAHLLHIVSIQLISAFLFLLHMFILA